jgi:hypothetical protein
MPPEKADRRHGIFLLLESPFGMMEKPCLLWNDLVSRYHDVDASPI